MKIGYIALCLIVPLLWGLASARLFDWWQKRRKPPASLANVGDDHDTHTSEPIYHI